MAEALSELRPVELSIVIVNWNSAEYVHSCIQSIVAETREVSYEIIVVDNASFDDCRNQLSQSQPGVVFLQSRHNVGFGGANNLGAEKARGSVLLFLNPDTVVRNRSIDRMCRHFSRIERPGVVGCRLLNSDGSLQTSCVQALPTVLNQVMDAELLRRWMPQAPFWGTRPLFGDGAVPTGVEAISGACMMLSRQLFREMYGFSSAFFMYGEDLDLCARVAAAGFHNLYLGDCEVIHHGGGSSRLAPSAFSIVMMCESVSKLLRRIRGPLSSGSYRLAMTVAAFLRLILLGMTYPCWVIRHKATSWSEAWRKWLTVLGWGLGINRSAIPQVQK